MTPEQMEIQKLRMEMDIMICLIWEMRGMFKGISGKLEKESEEIFKSYLDRKKMENESA